MALRHVRKIGDEILRKRSKEVDEINTRIMCILDDMKETMKKENGVGLAAPQIGILRRIIVIDPGDEGEIIEAINPEIISQEGEQYEVEGCLSVPKKYGKVKRPQKINVKSLNRHGEEVLHVAQDFLAKAFCHEIDHLNGVLFVDIAKEIFSNDESKD